MGIPFIGKDEAVKSVVAELERDFRKVLVAFDNAVVRPHPRVTGRAVNGWFMDFGSFTARQPTSFSKATSPNTNRGNAWTIESGNVYYHNSVEYIIYLDAGSSPQARQGILDPANAAIRGLF